MTDVQAAGKALISAFDEAIKNKDKIDDNHLKAIESAAKELFRDNRFVDDTILEKIEKKWFDLCGGTVHHGTIKQKLHGNSREVAMMAVLKRELLQKK